MSKGHRLEIDAAPSSSSSAHSGKLQTHELSIAFPVVAIGASAGGLEACTKLVTALPADAGMAFVLIQHLDPSHPSMMVELLAERSSIEVLQAADGMRVERGKFYVIPPGRYLAVKDGALQLSQPQARHGARLPFDFFLHSLATESRERAICIVLSGTGADGSIGLRDVKKQGGLVIAQDPVEAGFDGMPRNAINTGLVDLVLSAAQMPAAILNRNAGQRLAATHASPAPARSADVWLPAILDLLRTNTPHDFTSYKRGTLQRRIERRMAMAAIGSGDSNAYIEMLRNDPAELDLLANDLLINVTTFFRDAKVFDLLAKKFVPNLVRAQSGDYTFRVWIAGCSTGEEAYSIAILFREEITASKLNVKLQIFASDVDAEAIAYAREGLYPETVASDISSARLARFFTREDHGYRVAPELRATVVFTVQDVLADPPFSRLDLVSCRNLLIYLLPEAQAKVMSIFHFALREGGLLLLGNSETVGNLGNHFEIAAKAERVFRRIGGGRRDPIGFSMDMADAVRAPARLGSGMAPLRPAVLAALCQRLVAEDYGPAAVLINRKRECLYFSGATDTYLKIAPGNAVHDLLSMAREGVHAKLRSAIQRANDEKKAIIVSGGRMRRDGADRTFSIAVRPVSGEGEELLLVCFIDEHAQGSVASVDRAATPRELSRVAELERELEDARAELQDANRHLETVGEEQKAINEEARSVNEEYQSTNEELTTSKEELQSLNEELTALNSQLQETLERQRTTSNDLQNVLYSTDVATLFLDKALNIRFFTLATKLLFSVLPGDIGRPLADIRSLAVDGNLLNDAKMVLKSSTPIETEIEAGTGAWYLRRILPYRTGDTHVEGVVITFVDITERRHTSEALESARREAMVASLGKSRFLAAASHDLRQPLQTLVLLQGILAKNVQGDKEKKLVGRLGEAAGAMTGMLDALLDINQIEAGAVKPALTTFPLRELFDRLKEEFAYYAHAKGLALHIVPCSLSIHSDHNLFEQLVRNLLTNAIKYTKTGKVLLGCRRRRGILCVEVWDTGIGIPENEYKAIFDEYHQLDNAARERSRGLGLGLSIVQRLGTLLDHRITVRSRLGKGSVFSIEIKRSTYPAVALEAPRSSTGDLRTAGSAQRTGATLIVEDDPDVRELLGIFLRDCGHHTASAPDGVAALALAAKGKIAPDVILADYNLPNGMDGIETISALRAKLGHEIPAIILTGDISTETLQAIAAYGCEQLNKPVRLPELTQAIQRILDKSPPAVHAPVAARPAVTADPGAPTIFIVDDDSHVRDAIRAVLEDGGRVVEDYAACEDFLDAYSPGRDGCLLVDACLPGMSGLELLKRLSDIGGRLPSIMITGNGDVPMAVQAMKAGVLDFIEKPIGHDELVASVERALEQSRDAGKMTAWRKSAANHVADLTVRQRQVMDMVLAGHPSKNIAADLGISQRTVENHRAAVMRRTRTKSLPALARLALAAAWNGAEVPLEAGSSLLAAPKALA